MGVKETNRFQDFFQEDKYTVLKNYLYNYLLRKRAVENSLRSEQIDLALEVGSGISPVMTKTENIVYSDLSFTALKILKERQKKGFYVVADAMSLPFKSGVFSHTISSEVLEHLQDDKKAVSELARVMKDNGRFLVTFPHRKFYFANDDRFVKHLRRYELSEMEALLKEVGLAPISVEKVLGPLEKATMSLIVLCFSIIQRIKPKKEGAQKCSKRIDFVTPLFKWGNKILMALAWLDAKIMPRALSTVLLVISARSNLR